MGPVDRRWLLFGAVVAVTLSLRGPIVATAPVLDEVQEDLRISSVSAGLLTSIPVLCFAAASSLVPPLGRRVGVNAAVAAGLAMLTLGTAVRPWSGFGVMLLGTILVGVAITVGNVLIPVVIRRDFPRRPGPVLSAFTTSMIVSATLAALLTVPVASEAGWRVALAVWAVPALGSLLIWQAAVRPRFGRSTPGGRTGTASPRRDEHGQRSGTVRRDPGDPVRPRIGGSIWRAAAAWELAVFFGLQSLLYYAATTWLPTMLQAEGGLDAAAAGTALSIFQLLGIVGALVLPALMQRRSSRYAAALSLALLWVIFFLGLLLVPLAWPLWCVIGGVAQGGSLAMGLSLIATRAASADATRHLSGMVQTVGYSISASGPVLIGGISSAVAGWSVPFAVLITLSAASGVLGIRASASRPIGS